MEFLTLCIGSIGLFFVGSIILVVKRFSWKNIPTLLFAVAGLISVLIFFSPIEISSTFDRLTQAILWIGLLSVVIMERKELAKFFNGLKRQFKK